MDEILRKILSEAGWNPQDEFAEIRHYDCGAHCGDATDMGDASYDTVLVTKALARCGAVFCIDAVGDSMTGTGIYEGDSLMVRQQSVAQNDDVVLAIVEGNDVTVKNYVETDDGMVWLVPANPKYEPLCMCDYPNAKIVGVVVSVEHKRPRASHRECMTRINEARKRRNESELNMDEERLRRALQNVATMIHVNRQWFSVYRVLVDCGIVASEDYEAFASLLGRLLEEDAPSLDLKDLRSMSVGSFSKPVNLWSEPSAPVHGSRFRAYLGIAKMFRGALE